MQETCAGEDVLVAQLDSIVGDVGELLGLFEGSTASRSDGEAVLAPGLGGSWFVARCSLPSTNNSDTTRMLIHRSSPV